MGGVSTLVRAALPAVPVVNQLPGVRKRGGAFTGMTRERAGLRIERAHVDRYAEVCGFPRKDAAPLPYPHLLAFGLHMEVMADAAFPWPAIGTVHVENSITGHRRVHVGETLDMSVTADPPRAHAKGVLLDFHAVARAGAETVWESTSTYLRRGARLEGSGPEGQPGPGLDLSGPPPGGITWALPADLGRRYAAVSGDANPIHLYPLTARAFGFPRQIAHGMWTMARCVAALENRLPDAVRVEVAFKQPVLLPGAVRFSHEAAGGEHVFALTRPKDGAPHLLGRAVPGS